MSGLLTLKRLLRRSRPAGRVANNPPRDLSVAKLRLFLREWYSEREAFLFLFDPHPALGGRSPMEEIAQGRIGDVLAVIERLEEGAYL